MMPLRLPVLVQTLTAVSQQKEVRKIIGNRKKKKKKEKKEKRKETREQKLFISAKQKSRSAAKRGKF